ncbi:MAG: FecR domain-containing protein [Thermodesulfobacteriota bacterium]
MLGLFFLTPWLAGVGEAPAAAALGAVASAVTGEVRVILPDGGVRPLAVGDRVEAAYVIESAKGGKATLTLDDGSVVEVFEATRIEVNELLPEEKSKFSLSLFFGRIAAKLSKLRGDDLVITPTMVAGARGTEFLVGVADDGASVVSVNAGQVAVATDQEGRVTGEVQLGAGQEVEAAKLGEELRPRPLTLATLDDFLAFRQQRLMALQANMPEIIARLEKGIDPRLATLGRLQAMPVDRAKVLQDLDRKVKELKPEDAAQMAQLAIQAHMEAANLLQAVRDFRRERMRLRSTFVQSQRLQALLPGLAEQLGPQYQAVDQGLQRILARQQAVEQQEKMMAQRFGEALAPIQPLLKKFQAPPAEIPACVPTQPILDLFKKKSQ